MATTSSPYGLRPRNLLGGQPFAGSTRLYPIGSNYGYTIQYGDPVVLNAGADGTGGLIGRFNTTTTATTVTTGITMIGVFVGCTWTDATYGPTFRQNYPASTVASDIMAYVVDDPDALFEVQADGAITTNMVGSNAKLIQTVAGSSVANRISGVGIQQNSIAGTATFPIRIVDFVRKPGSTPGDTYTNVVVRLNVHLHRTATGNAIA